ncbi:MAG: hypothetical protein QGG28_08470, partial [Alphaproteobacteria bacterium]|nr:hypothetical protein [Alphaproteobacteria bacterium]HJM92889.1 hypothetical protein [Alphaproteobacteria bacterium]
GESQSSRKVNQKRKKTIANTALSCNLNYFKSPKIRGMATLSKCLTDDFVFRHRLQITSSCFLIFQIKFLSYSYEKKRFIFLKFKARTPRQEPWQPALSTFSAREMACGSRRNSCRKSFRAAPMAPASRVFAAATSVGVAAARASILAEKPAGSVQISSFDRVSAPPEPAGNNKPMVRAAS